MTYTIHAEIYTDFTEEPIECSHTDKDRNTCVAVLQKQCREYRIRRYEIIREYENETA